jgi:hypothetical protein
MSLLIKPNGSVEEVPTPRNHKDIYNIMDCNVEKWPYQLQLDVITGYNDKKYRFDIFVDDEGHVNGSPYNEWGTLASHPLNEARGRHIHGNVLLIPYSKGVSYNLDDWKAISKGIWALDCDCTNEELEDDLHDTICPVVELVTKNVKGPNATQRLR